MYTAEGIYFEKLITKYLSGALKLSFGTCYVIPVRPLGMDHFFFLKQQPHGYLVYPKNAAGSIIRSKLPGPSPACGSYQWPVK